MPQSRKRRPRKSPNRSASNPHQHPLGQAERAEMNGNDGKIKISILTSRQQGALPVIAAAPTLAHAARDCRVSESTIRRWLQRPRLRPRARPQATGVRQPAQPAVSRSPPPRHERPRRGHGGPRPGNLRLRATRYAMTFAVQPSGVHEGSTPTSGKCATPSTPYCPAGTVNHPEPEESEPEEEE